MRDDELPRADAQGAIDAIRQSRTQRHRGFDRALHEALEALQPRTVNVVASEALQKLLEHARVIAAKNIRITKALQQAGLHDEAHRIQLLVRALDEVMKETSVDQQVG
jgi:phage I-like protein